jgi:acyl homoserine lactone synthase
MSEVMLAQHGDGRLNDQVVAGMYRLRHTVFHDRLGWDVTSDNGMEYDEFDKCKPVYILVRGDDNEIEGCWRILPTVGPNMLRDVFPQLLHGQPVPQQLDVWELSRFALDTTRENKNTNFGLSGIPLRMIRMAFQFARENGITRYVSVTSVAIERMFRKAGIHVLRLGEPIKIGRVLTVACSMEIDSTTEFALFGTLPEHASRKVA